MEFSFKDGVNVRGETHLVGRFKRRNGHFAAAAGGETLWRRADGLSDGDGPWRGHWSTLGQNPSCGKGKKYRNTSLKEHRDHARVRERLSEVVSVRFRVNSSSENSAAGRESITVCFQIPSCRMTLLHDLVF